VGEFNYFSVNFLSLSTLESKSIVQADCWLGGFVVSSIDASYLPVLHLKYCLMLIQGTADFASCKITSIDIVYLGIR